MNASVMRNETHVLLLAPVIFVCHFLEESPGFVEWFNGHVSRGITPGLFWRVNISALVITILVVLGEWVSRSSISLSLAIGWLSLLMFANAIFHIVGGVVDQGYVPGLATAVLVYLPYYSWFLMQSVKSRRIKIGWLIPAIILGSLPMLIHGYLILFRGSRLL
jgi:Protein of unknown function with HXXEE motif